jgi:predicted membrane-bound spermidine synthase
MEEKQVWGTTKYDIIPGSHILFETVRAHIDLITNPHFGRMLFIDRVLQCSQSDEEIYHSALVDYAKPKGRVLIAGGAEGATAREVFKRSVSKVVMVDWDAELVAHMRSEPFSKGAFDNPLLELVSKDILSYLTGCGYFDTVIIDLLDPSTREEIEWLSSVCVLAFTQLNVGCTMAVNAGGDYAKMRALVALLNERCGVKPEYTASFVPSFQEIWYLIRICKV